MMHEKQKLKSSIKYPTTIIIRGDNFLAFEIAKSLIEQGGYVIVIDYDIDALGKRYDSILNSKLLTLLDFETVEFLDEDLRRLDYVFFFNHEFDNINIRLSSKEFLEASNYLDMLIKVSLKFDAKFLLTSSIKAHQILLNDGSLDIEFGVNAKDKNVVYSQIEIQRYAESLVVESIEKNNLNARIVRLAKIIGPGMDFDPNDSFDKLIIDAVLAKQFKLKSDGLQSNLYIHVLDCAYGLIKAMFSRGTKGKVFSLANDEEVTDLSIAYKLQELTGLSHDIKFIDDKDNYPPIRFYKPAESLKVIGWKPRISFIRALSQTLEYAREKFSKDENLKIDDNEELEIEKEIRNFEDDEPKGALARLIAERKAQERMRKSKIYIANEKINQEKKKKRKLSFTERLERKFINLYDKMSNSFEFLKKITVKEALFYFFSFLFFGIIYISFISPIFLTVRYILEIKYYNFKLNTSSEINYDDQYYYLNNITDKLQGISVNLDNLEGIYSLIDDRGFKRERDILNKLRIYVYSLTEGSNLVSAFDNYWKTQDEFNVLYTPSSASLLSVVANDSNLDTKLKDGIKAQAQNIDQLKAKLDLNRQALEDTDLINIFSVFDLNNLFSTFVNIDLNLQRNLSLMQIYDTFLFDAEVKTYAFILQDNSRFTAGGGYPATIGFIQIKDGKLINIELKAFHTEDDLPITNFTDSQLKTMQIYSGKLPGQKDVVFSDLFLVKDKSEFSSSFNEYFFEEFKIESDGIIFMNLQTLSDIIEVTSNIEFNQVVISKESLLTSINLLNGSDATLNKRNDIISNIFAMKFEQVFKNRENLYLIYPVLKNAFDSGNVDIMGDDILFTSNENDYKDWIEVSASIDKDMLSPKVYPSMNMKVSDKIDNELNLTRTITILKGNLDGVDQVIVCIPTNASDIIYKQDGYFGQSFDYDKICLTSSFTFSDKLSFSYKLSNVASLEKNEYNIFLELRPADGLSLIYDQDITLPASFNLEDKGALILSSENKLITSGVVVGSKDINFKLSK